MKIGVHPDSKCEIITATTTQITCKTPAKNANYAGAQNIVVNVKGLLDSTCKIGPCTFRYDTATPSTITGDIAEGDSYFAGTMITIAGTGLTGM